MTMYLNIAADGDRIAAEIGTPKGIADFSAWASSLPAKFALVRKLAQTGKADGDKKLEDQLKAALKAKPPNPSARSVAERLIEVVPWRGTMTISDEPEDDELDDDEE